MLPSILAKQLEKGLVDYIDTTFPMTNDPFKGSLKKLLSTKGAVYHDPYIAVRLPFRTAQELPKCFEAIQQSYKPYVHQEKAFARLVGDNGKSTLIATGTGSGKTECFLYPVLEYCYQHRGEKGIKAVIIYPMNALASDQAKRIANLIYDNDKLRGNVTAGMYVGGIESAATVAMDNDRVITDHNTMLNTPPDILLTNYKMLDYLLVRPKDAELWNDNATDTLKYIAVDELHTFDGAQGTDLACLIRRLKKRLGVNDDKLCCIGTSATMGSKSSTQDILSYAESIFDVKFDENAVIMEDRLTAKEYFSESEITEFKLPSNTQARLMEALVEEDDYRSYLSFAVQAWFNNFNLDIMSAEGRLLLGEKLKQHAFVQGLLFAMQGKYCQISELLERLEPQFPELKANEKAETIIYSALALISHARISSKEHLRPFLNVQVQLWIRELRRFLAKVDNDIDYSIFHDLNEQQAKQYLPIVNCRDCGATGWVTMLNERGCASLNNLDVFYNKFFQIDPSVMMLFPIPHSKNIEGMVKAKICPNCLHVETASMTKATCSECGTDLIEVQWPVNKESSGGKKKQYECPLCGSRRGISLIGLRNATEISALLSQIFASKFNDDKKTLAFSDSVQDAAHKAGFFNSRTWHSGLRRAIQEYVDKSGQKHSLQAFTDGFIEYWHNKYANKLEDYIGLFIAPNMVWRNTYENLCKRRSYLGTQEEQDLLKSVDKRLRYEIMLEYGVSGKIGRTLEKAGCSTLAFDMEQIDRIAENVQERAVNELGLLTQISRKKLQQMVLGYFNLVKQSGAFADPVFYKMLEEKGKTYTLSADYKPHWWLPGRRTGRNTPRFLMWQKVSGASGEGLGCVNDRKYQDWLYEFLGTDITRDSDVSDLCRFIAEEACKAGLFVEMPSPLPTKIYGLNKEKVYVSKNVKQLVCDKCGAIYAFDADAAVLMKDASCFRRECNGKLKVGDGAALDYYGKLYSNGDTFRIYAKEHTGLLQREDRELLEENFKAPKDKHRMWDPNVLSCTPTLEMGIDIGDLSTVILCSMPPAQAQFLQRVGRAGRKDGNALTLAVANSRQHDLYFYAEPREMIDGNVKPPKIFLKANAVLERQFVAFAMDSWVKTKLPDNAVPKNISFVLRNLDKHASDIFPFNFLRYVQANLTSLTTEFIGMFQGELDKYAQDEIIKFAQGAGLEEDSMRVKILAAFNQQKLQIEGIQSDIKVINESIKELEDKPKDSSFDLEIKELKKEKLALLNVIQDLHKKNVYNFLSDEGLLPNYAFPEAGVVLKAILYREEETENQEQAAMKLRRPLVFEYNRSASAAISDFAPNNSFYAEGRKLKIDRLDVKTSQPSKWRLCPNCSYMELYDPTKHVAACPRCGSLSWADNGQVNEMLKIQMVYSSDDYKKTLIGDESDDRSNVFYNKKLLVDVNEEHDIISAYRMDNDDFPFGYEFVSKADIKEINFGESDKQGPKLTVAGEEQVRKGFKICRHCGKIQSGEKKHNHAAFCIMNKKALAAEDDYINCLFLYRQFNTEALRILIPATTQATTTVKKESFVAAFMLGMQEYFGNVGHLRATISEVPVPDATYRKQYLVIYDSVPGGTGYLKQLMSEQGAFVTILEKALVALENCVCKDDPHKDGCYRCLYAYRQSQNIGNISREAAIKMLRAILRGKDNLQKINKLSDIPVNSLFDSELEALFIEVFSRMSNSSRQISIEKDIINGKEGYLLKINNQLWEIEPQVSLGKGDGVSVTCKPDFVIRSLKGTNKLPVAIFTDGFTYHQNIADEDTLKREAIRRSGNYHVWSLSYNDVKQVFEEQGDYYTHTLDYNKMPSGKGMYEGIANMLNVGEINPEKVTAFELLLYYLAQENAEEVLRKQAQAYSYTLLSMSLSQNLKERDKCYQVISELQGQTNFDSMEIASNEVMLGNWSPLLDGDITIYSVISQQQLCKMITAATVFLKLNDVETTRSEHYKEEWNGFWHFWNLMQFIPEFIAVSEKGLENDTYKALPYVIDDTVPAISAAVPSPWEEIIHEQLFDEEAIAFAKDLKAAGIAPDQVGYELEADNEEIILEFAWPDVKLAYLTADEVTHAQTLEKLGWTIVKTVSDVKEKISGGK